jgi:hypothetical protein
MSYYHYPKGSHLVSIVKNGIIKTTNKGCEKKEKPAAWLTKIPECEVDTVTATFDYMKKEIDMCRILISETLPTISWAEFKYVSGISGIIYHALDDLYRKFGCQNEKLFCTFNSIPKKYWEGIEMFVDDQWVRWDEKMPIQEFVNLCLSCNGKQKIDEKAIRSFPEVQCQNQVDFIYEHYDEIIRLWEANKHKKGYIQIYITPDYKPYPCGFKFIEKRVWKSTFSPFKVFEGETKALVHFLWEATFTQFRMGIAYDKEIIVDTDKSFSN